LPFPPRDVVTAFGVHLHFKAMEQELCERHPGMANRVRFDDSKGVMRLAVMLDNERSVILTHFRVGHTLMWGVIDPLLNSEPSIWPLHTPNDVLLDVLHAHASAILNRQPLASPWRWNESESSELTELADLLDEQGVKVRRVAAGNGYFAYGSRHALKLDIIGERARSFVEAQFPGAFVRVSLKPALGWLVDVHTPDSSSWRRLALNSRVPRKLPPIPGVPPTDLPIEIITDLLCQGPEAWDVMPHGHPDEPGEDSVSGGSRRPLSAPENAEVVLEQLMALGFTDLTPGEGGVPIASDYLHFEWRNSSKALSTPDIQQLNGRAAAAGDMPKRLILITSAGLTRPAADFADQAKAFVFCLDHATRTLMPLNSRARETLLPSEPPGTRELEPW
jgi:hypothetical protein